MNRQEVYELETIPTTEMSLSMELSRLRDSPSYLGLARRASSIGLGLKGFKVTNEATEIIAVDTVASIMEISTSAEDLRKSITAWPRKFIEMVNGIFKLLTAELAKHRAVVEQQLSIYRIRKETEAARQRAALQRQVDKANSQAEKKGLQKVEVVIPETKAPAVVRTEMATSYERVEWCFEVTDILEFIKTVAEGKERPEALLINEKYIQHLIDSGIRAIPGIRVFEKKSVIFRRKYS